MAESRLRCVVQARRAFTLLELLITLGLVAVLIGLLTPALGLVRESAQRLTCSSHQHSVGSGMALYAKDHRDRIPPSYFGSESVRQPQEMMAATVGSVTPIPDRFEGVGWLAHRAGGYLDSDACLFCPSHHGKHVLPEGATHIQLGGPRIYTHYHYRGDYDLAAGRWRRIDEPWETIFFTDGLRTRTDFNHGSGANRLHGDLSVSWWQDSLEKTIASLPEDVIDPEQQAAIYQTIWDALIEP